MLLAAAFEDFGDRLEDLSRLLFDGRPKFVFGLEKRLSEIRHLEALFVFFRDRVDEGEETMKHPVIDRSRFRREIREFLQILMVNQDLRDSLDALTERPEARGRDLRFEGDLELVGDRFRSLFVFVVRHVVTGRRGPR